MAASVTACNLEKDPAYQQVKNEVPSPNQFFSYRVAVSAKNGASKLPVTADVFRAQKQPK